MAHEIRSPSDVLNDMLLAIAASDAGPAVLGALRASVIRRIQMVKGLPQTWTVSDALAALDPQDDNVIELFAALRLLEGAQPGRARLGYSHLAEEDPVRLDQALLLEFARTEITRGVPSERDGSSSAQASSRARTTSGLGSERTHSVCSGRSATRASTSSGRRPSPTSRRCALGTRGAASRQAATTPSRFL